MSQTAFAERGGVTKKTQMLYEGAERFPDAAYLAAIAQIGADIQYIVTGIRSDMALTPDERQLLALFRSAPLTGKMAAVGALQGALSSGSKQVVHGNVTGQVVEGGLVNKGPVKISNRRREKK